MSLFAKNIRFLRTQKEIKTSDMVDAIGFNASQWNNYENDRSKPRFDDLVKIAKYFGVSESDLIHTDLEDVHLNKKEKGAKNGQNVHLNVHGNVHPKSLQYPDKPSPFVTAREGDPTYSKESIKDELIRTQAFTIEMLKAALAAAQSRVEEAKKAKK